ncbi:MAG: transposase [Porticoccaceae bacterium]
MPRWDLCQGKGSDEQTLLRSIQDTSQSGDIVLGDAFFATYFFIAAMQAKGVDIVMEQHGSRKKSTDFRCGQRLGSRDHLIVIEKPAIRPEWMSEAAYEAAPGLVTVRELKVGGKIMVTTLLCAKEVAKFELKALYKGRWHVELDIRSIKATMGMGILSCKTPSMITKGILVYLLAYNLIRLMMAQSAALADIAPRMISFKHGVQLWLVSAQLIEIAEDKQLLILFVLMAQQRVANRSGRIEPRAVKRRPKSYPLLTKPRAEAREESRANGHPKKLK